MWRYYFPAIYKKIAQDSYELSASGLWIINQTFLFVFVSDVYKNGIDLKLEQKRFIHISKHIEILLHYLGSHQGIRKARHAGNQIM